jgi:hypothetical protein
MPFDPSLGESAHQHVRCRRRWRYVEDGAGQIAEIVRRLDRDHIHVGAISVSRPSLDDVFLKATGRRLEGQAEQTQSQQEVTS